MKQLFVIVRKWIPRTHHRISWFNETMAAIGPSGHYIGVRPAPPRQTRVHKEVIVSTDDCINMLRAINEKPFDRARFQQLVGRYPRLCKRPIPNIRRQSVSTICTRKIPETLW